MAEGQSKLPAELEWVKVIPGSQLIIKALLRYQIQQLLTQLSEFTEEESLLLMASAVNGGYSYLGSKPGKNFMASQHRLLSAFLEFCVKHSASSDSATTEPSNPEQTTQNSRPGTRIRTPSEAVFSSIQATSSSPSSSTAETSYPTASATSSPLAISTVASEATIGSVTDQILAEGTQISPDKRSACKSRRFHPYIKSKSVTECNSNKDGDMCMQEKGAISGLKNNPRFRVKGPYVDTFHVISIPSVCTEQTRGILDHANMLRLQAEDLKVHTISSPSSRTEQNLDTSGQESQARLGVVSVQGGLQVQKETAPDLSVSKTAPDLSLTEASPDLSSKSMSTDLPLPEVKIEVLEDLQPGAFPCNVNESETSIRPRLDSVKSDTESDTGEGISMDQGVLLLSPGAVLPLSSSAETQTQGLVLPLSSTAEPQAPGAALPLSSSAETQTQGVITALSSTEPQTPGVVLPLSSSAEAQTQGAVLTLSSSAEPHALPQVEPHVKMEVLEDIAEITHFESSLQRTDSSDLDNSADLDLASTNRQELSVDAVKTERADPEQIPTAVPRAYFRNISIWQRAVTVVAMAMETTDCSVGLEEEQSRDEVFVEDSVELGQSHTASHQNTSIGHKADPDVDKVPDAVPRGNFQPVKMSRGKPSIITFDLQTTDIIRGGVMPHITQIAATNVLSGDKFNVYVKPGCPVASEAQALTGISVKGNNMTVRDEPVEPLDIKTALEAFSTWIKEYQNVCLVANNGRRFDYPVLVHTLVGSGLKERYIAAVTAFVDSSTIFKKLFPNSSCFKQESLVYSIFNTTYDAHNAIAAVESLGKLLQHCNVCNKRILDYSFAPVAMVNYMLFNQQKYLNIRSLDPLVCNGIFKRHTAENIAGSGLNMNHLQIIYKQRGEDGLRDVFVEKNSEGQPRVTNYKKILDVVVSKLGEFLSAQK